MSGALTSRRDAPLNRLPESRTTPPRTVPLTHTWATSDRGSLRTNPSRVDTRTSVGVNVTSRTTPREHTGLSTNPSDTAPMR